MNIRMTASGETAYLQSRRGLRNKLSGKRTDTRRSFGKPDFFGTDEAISQSGRTYGLRKNLSGSDTGRATWFARPVFYSKILKNLIIGGNNT
jgi:hypothetical protein